MSELGEISAELDAALARLARVARRFAELDRSQLGPLQAELARSPEGRPAASLIARARTLVRQAETGANAARSAGGSWLTVHGSGEAGGATPGDAETGSADSITVSAVSGVAAAGSRTSSGRAYFAVTEGRQRACAEAVPPFEGEYALVIHGNPGAVGVAEHELDALGLAELVRSDPEWGGRPVRLVSCATGRGENPIAAQLADELGVEVRAPDDSVWIGHDGSVVVAPPKVVVIGGREYKVPDTGNSGTWRVFAPRRRGDR